MPPPARVNFVEAANWSGVTSTTYAAPAQSVTAGNALVVCVGADASSGQSVTGVTDTAGHTYVKCAHVFNSLDNYRQEIWVAANITTHATNVVTATWSAVVGYRAIVVMQYSGLDPTTPLDDTQQKVNSPLTTPTLTGTTAESVHILMTRWGFGSTGFPAGFTEFTTPGGAVAEVADQVVTGGAFSGTYTVTSGNYFVIAAIFKAPGGAGGSMTRVTQSALEVLWVENATARVTQSAIEVLYGVPPTGGGEIPPGPLPPVDPQVGDVYRLFFQLRGGTPHAELLSAETTLRDPPSWYGGFKGARLVKVSPITRELAENGELHGVEVTVTLADTDRGVRNLAWTGTLLGAYGALYVVSDETRYALGEPYRLFAGIVQGHRALPGFQYEFRLVDTLSARLADLDSAPRIPPDRLALADFPGMAPEAEGRAVPIVLGEASDEVHYLPDRGPQGVVPPVYLGTLNFAAAWGGSAIDVDAYIWSAGALVTPGGVWGVYYNNAQPLAVATLTGSGTTATLTTSDPHLLTALDAVVVSGATPEEYNGTWPVTVVDALTVTYTAAASLSGPASGAAVMPARAVRTPIPDSSWGVDVWTPGKPGWAMTGLTTDYADYHGRRYTPFFVRRDHPLAEAARTGQIFVAGNLFGLAENSDGTGNYLDDPSRVWQWILVNQLFVPYQTGDYADMPLLDESYGILDSDSVEAAVTAQHARLAGGYPVGFLLGRNGEQQTLRHILTELCRGADMEQGINRHGQAMVSVEDVDAPAIATFTDLHDIEDGEFEVWLDHDAYRNRIEHTYGFRYVPPSAPGVAPAEGAPLPRRVQSFDDWTSGLVVREDAAAITAVGGRKRTLVVENYVVRNPIVANDLETRWLARWVGPTFDGPMRFRLRTSWQGLGLTGTPIELGSVIAITHLEGIGPEGWINVRGRVLRIEVDPQAARVTLEGRIIAGLPEGGP